jgi:hypothetical protein
MHDSSGIINPEIFYKYLMEFSVTSRTESNSAFSSKIGYKIYSSIDEIKDIFRELEILDYQKVYFFDRPDISMTHLPNFEQVESLEKRYSVDLIKYNPHDFTIKVNGMPSNSFEVVSTGQGKVGIKNLRKTDKLEIFRGSSQPITSFYVKDQQLVTLPLPKIEQPSHFTIRNLDPSRYRVKVDGQEQLTSHMSGSELKIAISTEHVIVEIVDKTTNAIVHTHDTTLNKTYVMLFQGGNGTYRPPVGGSGGNSAGSSIGFTEEPKKKSKTALILTLCSVVLLAGLGITGWLLWFEGENEKPPISGNGTKNTTPNVGSDNEVSNENEQEEVKLINPEGLTVKPGKESILTEKGLNKEGSFYRYFENKWEVKPKTADGTKSNWQTLKEADKTFIIALFFSINTVEQNKKIEEEKKIENNNSSTNIVKTNPVQNTNSQTSSSNLLCKTLEKIKEDAEHFYNNIENSRVEDKKKELLNKLKSLSDEECIGCKPSKSDVKAAILKITGY